MFLTIRIRAEFKKLIFLSFEMKNWKRSVVVFNVKRRIKKYTKKNKMATLQYLFA